MRLHELTHLTLGALVTQRLRSALTALGIAIGVFAVVLLTAIGEGVQQFMLSEFTQFGTHLIGVNPGKTTTMGGSIGVFGSTRPLTLDDAEALATLPEVVAVEPVVAGNAEVEGNGRTRRTLIYGVGGHFPEVFSFTVAQGRFLPDDDPRAARAYAVLGSTLYSELFGDTNPLGARIRVGGQRYRVIGVMESKGQVLGMDLDDTVYIPVQKGLELFDREGLMEIDLLYRAGADEAALVEGIKRRLTDRHGRDDFTITTQQQMMEVLGSILDVITFAVGALGGISLLVGGVGILTIMTIAVSERTAEIGLLRALGAGRKQVLALFLAEATLLSLLGGLLGLGAGLAVTALLAWLLPALPIALSWPYIFAALGVAGTIGLSAGVLPARHAAGLDPVEALRTE